MQVFTILLVQVFTILLVEWPDLVDCLVHLDSRSRRESRDASEVRSPLGTCMYVFAVLELEFQIHMLKSMKACLLCFVSSHATAAHATWVGQRNLGEKNGITAEISSNL